MQYCIRVDINVTSRTPSVSQVGILVSEGHSFCENGSDLVVWTQNAYYQKVDKTKKGMNFPIASYHP